MFSYRSSFLPVDGWQSLWFGGETRFNGLELLAVLRTVAFRRMDGQAGGDDGAEERQFDVQGRRPSF